MLAERVGFEPTVRLPVRRISSAVQSTTLPPLRNLKRRAAQNGAVYLSKCGGPNKGGWFRAISGLEPAARTPFPAESGPPSTHAEGEVRGRAGVIGYTGRIAARCTF